jgi:predicted nucleic acid-binding protein
LSIYLDANVLVALVALDHFTVQARAFAARNPEALMTSDFADAETVSAVGRMVRMKTLTAAAANEALALLDGWLPTFVSKTYAESDDIQAAATMLREFELRLRTPDAINLAIAQRHNAELATFDKAMATAARKLGVKVAKL